MSNVNTIYVCKADFFESFSYEFKFQSFKKLVDQKSSAAMLA